MKRKFQYTRNDIKDWFEELGYEVKINTSTINIIDKETKASETIYTYDDGVEVGHSARLLKNKNTIIKNVINEIHTKNIRIKKNNKERLLRERGTKVAESLGINLEEYGNQVSSKGNTCTIKIRLSNYKLFSDLEFDKYGYDSIIFDITEYDNDVKVKVRTDTSTVEVFERIPKLVNKIKDMFYVTGI